MISIKLPHGVWQYDPDQPLGPKGGFGIVFAGTSPEYGALAVKKIFLEAQRGAHRELRIADELKAIKFEHIVPIYDAGQDADSGINYVVMARADGSIQQELDRGRKYSEEESIGILLQIVTGLVEVPGLVHRDLKPGNILFHDGKWKIADFGIAKFIEESTSLQTLQSCLSPHYAAPEQWEYERPTHAVDVYALGCVGYALITGQPPFSGTTIDELKCQHLHDEPPLQVITNPRLHTLLSMALRKTPETRPSLERVKALLEELATSDSQHGSGAISALAEAAVIISDQTAKEEARKRTEQDEQKNREKIAREAREILWKIVEYLFQRIIDFAPNAQYFTPLRFPDRANCPDRNIILGPATLSVIFSRFASIPKESFSQCKWTVLTGAVIEVKQETAKPYVWSANLWFTNLGKHPEYRWWEVSYMSLVTHSPICEPYAIDDLNLADRAAAPIMDVIQLGAKPKLVDDEAIDQFCDRWIEILAKAAKGELTHPSRLPLD
jgi:serine/threonine-protein kinase